MVLVHLPRKMSCVVWCVHFDVEAVIVAMFVDFRWVPRGCQFHLVVVTKPTEHKIKANHKM